MCAYSIRRAYNQGEQLAISKIAMFAILCVSFVVKDLVDSWLEKKGKYTKNDGTLTTEYFKSGVVYIGSFILYTVICFLWTNKIESIVWFWVATGIVNFIVTWLLLSVVYKYGEKFKLIDRKTD